MKTDSQLTMSFQADRKPRSVSPASRILNNYRHRQRKIYFSEYQQFKRDTFIALNGVQTF